MEFVDITNNLCGIVSKKWLDIVAVTPQMNLSSRDRNGYKGSRPHKVARQEDLA